MQGHIRKRGNSWAVVISLGRDPATGKRKQLWRSVRGTKRDAQALLVQLLHQRDQGIDQPSGRMTVAEYLQQWLSVYAKVNTAPKTYKRYEEIARVHLVPVVGAIPLTKLRPLHIQEVYTRVLQKGLSARTALHCHRVLREALQHALKWQIIPRNPADSVEPPRPHRYEATSLEPDGVKRLFAAADETPYGALIHLALMTGLRQGELLGLRWQHVNLESAVLQVRQTCQWLPREGFIFRQPKTYRSARPVALSPASVERLHRHRVQQLQERLAVGPAYQDNGLVFANARGAPVHPTNLRRAWLQIVGRVGLGHLRFHDLRHTHASLLLQQGIHPKIVSERLGHSSVSITLDTYSHVVPSLQVQAAAGLDELLAKR